MVMPVPPALESWLKPLDSFLNQEDLIELSVIKPQEVRLELAERGYVTQNASHLEKSYWENLCYVLANHNGQSFDPVGQPRISVMLPGGHRFEAMMGSNVESQISVSIRMRRSVKLKFEDFGLCEETQKVIQEQLVKGSNILISGGTSSGKTTFMNRLIEEIPNDKRILVLEDTRELNLSQDNHVHYLVSRNEKNPVIDYPQMIDHLMRSRPDIILMGELSVPNAFPILRLLNSGHSGFICTLHANSADLALSWAVPQNIKMAGHSTEGVTDFLYEAVDLVVQLHKNDQGKRCVCELFFPKTKKRIHVT